MSGGTPKLFEQNLNGAPADVKRLAYGEPGAISETMTFGQLKTLLRNGLGVLLQSNSLSDVDAATARDNLSVLSESEINALLSGVATLLDPGSGQVPGINNTVNWPITSPYQPVHKTYADNVVKISSLVTISYAGNNTDFNNEQLKCRRQGNNFHVTGTFQCQNSKTSPVLLAAIPGYVSPGHSVYFVGQQQETSNLEGGYGYVNTAGEIYFKPGKGSNQTWVINVPIIGGSV